jgi:YVTN family beta-propeller protein
MALRTDGRSMSSRSEVAGVVATLLFCLGALCAYAQAQARINYGILDRWLIGGTAGWDYLAFDAAGRRLFVTRQDHVDVIDTATGRRSAAIADTLGVHGIALAPDQRRGYSSNGGAASVTMFDLETLRTLKTGKVSGTNPDAIVYEPVGRHVFTFNGGSANATVLDALTLDVIATIALPDKPEFAVVDGTGRVYVNIESAAGQLVVIDAKALAVVATWQLPGCARPTGLAFDPARLRLFSVCAAGTLVVTDARSGRQVQTLPIGEHPDAAAFDQGLGLVFSSNGDGTLTIIHADDPDHYRVAATLMTQKSARTMALDPVSHRVYLAAAQFGPAPQATAAQLRSRPPILPDTFTILVAAPL